MNTKPSPIVFLFRGFVSWGDEVIRLGPVKIDPYFQRVQRQLKGITTVSVTGMGNGTVEEMTEGARKFLDQNVLFNTLNRPVHFFGHSMGGLVARKLVHAKEIHERVVSVTTMGTPHQGICAAEMDDRTSAMKIVRRLAHSHRRDAHTDYESIRPKDMYRFNSENPNHSDIHYASFVCAVPPSELPVSLRIVHNHYNQEISDGLVPESSQAWGQILGRTNLDHLEQIGICQDLNPLKRWQFRRNFEKVCQGLSKYWQGFS